MKLSRDWLHDYVDLTGVSDDDLKQRFTEIGHAVDSMERHGDDTVFDLEITTNRVDAMSHLGMARELAAALGREVRIAPPTPQQTGPTGPATIRIEAPEMCERFSGLVIRGVTIKPSPPQVQRRLEAVGLRPISNVVDVTNYVMLALGHPMHAYDLDRVADATILVRAGKPGEKLRTLDNELRAIDAETVVIADGKKAIGLGGIMGGFESEITSATKDLLLECAWFNPSVVRRTKRRLGMLTDAAYRFERRVDPNDTTTTIELAAQMILESAGGTRDGAIIDVVAKETKAKTIRLRSTKLAEQSGDVIGIGYALSLFVRLGFQAKPFGDDIDVIVPTYRGDIFEEMDLVEEVLRFYGLNKVPASLPRLTTGDARPYAIGETEDAIRRIVVGSGLTEAVNYSFIHPEHNPLFSDEKPALIINALNENIAAMRLSLIPGLLENVVFNRSYGTRDGALFEVGRTYHRQGDGLVERHRIAIVMYGSIGTFWGDAKRPVDFFDIKGVVAQIAEAFHVELAFETSDESWLRKGKRAVAKHGDRVIASVGFLASEVLQRFDIKGDVAAAQIDVQALLESTSSWKMTEVARFPGVPMILAMTHGRELEYGRIEAAIRALDVPYLHEVGLRDRYEPPGDEAVKTTLGMWYQAFDRSLTQDEVGGIHQQLAARVAELLPIKLIGGA
ncbi:MAG TPA: phenylalanine--tRNA ligase subunit beta [Thermoanaerobaculia bacterium]|nr:phenylalanine--tRNA ligase subunit beta [Thermoanaerobaculia bacterium]